MNAGNFKLITEAWKWNAEHLPDNEAVIHWTAGEKPVRWTFSELYHKAGKYKQQILSSEIKSGEVCALIFRHNKDFYPLYMGVVLSGAIPAVLAYPNNRLHPEKFKEGIIGMSQRSGLDWIFTDNEAGTILTELLNDKITTVKGILYPLNRSEIKSSGYPAEDEKISEGPLLLQHSSGTTGLQKPVLLSHKAVITHLQNYSDSLNLTPEDKIVSWLPLYHDMGLIAAFHLPLFCGIPFIQIDPFEWISIPSLLPEVVSIEKGTITWIPNFAFNVLADKVHDDDLKDISLESWRLIINCSEPVRNESHRKFLDKYKKYGLKELALSSSYAMAETTFAVTQSPPGERIYEVKLARKEIKKGKILIDENGKIFLSSGKTIKGCSVKIVDEIRNPVASGNIGELAVNSESLFEGYRNYPEKTAAVLQDGWYYTGDLGFELDEFYFVTGRKKDLIIVAGNNIYPEDIESALSGIKGIIPGRVIAAGEYNNELGSELVIVIAETETDDKTEQKILTEDIIKTGMSMDVTISKVYLVPPRWLIKSSAGKPARKINAERIGKVRK